MFPRNRGSLTAAMGLLMGLAALPGADVTANATTGSPTARAGGSIPHDQAVPNRSPDQQAARERWLATRHTRPGRARRGSTGSHKQNRRRLLVGR